MSIFPNRSTATIVMAILMSIYSLQTVAEMPNHDNFNDSLSVAYQALSNVELAAGDHRDADTYAARSAAAKAGSPTTPEDPQLRNGFLKEYYLADLTTARTRLMTAFDKGARDKASTAAATAQSAYDCWLEQAAENLQDEHINACRESYNVAIVDVEKALIPPPMVAAVDPDSDMDGVPDSRDDCPGTPQGTPVDSSGCPELPTLEGVHFELDKAVITASARSILDDAVAIIESNPHVRINIVGHTDSSGSDAYNQRLSDKRAEATRSYLESRNISGNRLSAEGRGETSPIADNGTKEGRRANRRVELTARPAE